MIFGYSFATSKMLSKIISKMLITMGESGIISVRRNEVITVDVYTPPFTITNRVVTVISQIAEKLGHISNYREFESKPYLRRNNRIRSILPHLLSKPIPCHWTK